MTSGSTFTFPLLSSLVWLPILGGFATLAFGDARANAARWFATLVAVATLGLSVLLFTYGDYTTAANKRVFQAMLRMGRIDVAELRAAHAAA